MSSDQSDCLTKADLIDSIYDNLPFDKQKATQLVEDWIELIKDGEDPFYVLDATVLSKIKEYVTKQSKFSGIIESVSIDVDGKFTCLARGYIAGKAGGAICGCSGLVTIPLGKTESEADGTRRMDAIGAKPKRIFGNKS